MTTAPLLKEISLSSIRPSATNPRKSFDPRALEELADSIREQGVQVPMLVRPVFDPEQGSDDVYELVCGERRYRACTLAGKQAAPCLVREMTDAEVLDVQITENLQRADVHPVEEAAAYAALIEAAAWPSDPDTLARELTVEDVARKVGKRLDYVAKRMKLLSLHELATRLFAEGHITLDHALRLAVLTPKNQVEAMVYLLGIAKWEIKRDKPAELLIADRMTQWAKDQVAEHRERWVGRRLVSPTEVELKRWISEHVLLQLKAAPWRLDDAALVPPAGACTTCPKRSGSNVALFGDLTAEDDVCLDAECFAAKRKAHVQYLVNEAKVSGGILLKLSSKPGEERLPEGGVTEKTLLKKGQWVPAPPNAQGERSCAAAAKGLLRDGDEAGSVLWVCALQSCKVHKHRVESAERRSNNANDPVERERREKAQREALAAELPVRRAVYDAMLRKVHPQEKLLQLLVEQVSSRSAAEVCVAMGIAYDAPKGGEPSDWNHQRAPEPALSKYIAGATLEQLHLVAFHTLYCGELTPQEWTVLQRGKGRERLWAGAKRLKVDAEKIAASVAPAAEKPAAKKAVAKKAAAKKASVKATKSPAPKKLTSARQKAIADAMKKRLEQRSKLAAKAAAKKSAGGKAVKA